MLPCRYGKTVLLLFILSLFNRTHFCCQIFFLIVRCFLAEHTYAASMVTFQEILISSFSRRTQTIESMTNLRVCSGGRDEQSGRSQERMRCIKHMLQFFAVTPLQTFNREMHRAGYGNEGKKRKRPVNRGLLVICPNLSVSHLGLQL